MESSGENKLSTCQHITHDDRIQAAGVYTLGDTADIELTALNFGLHP